MTPFGLITELADRNIFLLDNGSQIVPSPNRGLSRDERNALREHQAALRAILQEEEAESSDAVPDTASFVVDGDHVYGAFPTSCGVEQVTWRDGTTKRISRKIR